MLCFWETWSDFGSIHSQTVTQLASLHSNVSTPTPGRPSCNIQLTRCMPFLSRQIPCHRVCSSFAWHDEQMLYFIMDVFLHVGNRNCRQFGNHLDPSLRTHGGIVNAVSRSDWFLHAMFCLHGSITHASFRFCADTTESTPRWCWSTQGVNPSWFPRTFSDNRSFLPKTT